MNFDFPVTSLDKTIEFIYVDGNIQKQQLISTSLLCSILDVSRSWVNNHLRHLGGKEPQSNREKKNKKTIYYSVTEVLQWINDNARFYRQTEQLDLLLCADKEVLDAGYGRIQEMPTDTIAEIEAQAKAYETFLKSFVPEQLVDMYLNTNNRQRGLLPWEEVQWTVESLDQLWTMKALLREQEKKSTEMVYRDLFDNGAVKVVVFGRTWYIKPPAMEKRYRIVIPCKVKEAYFLD